MFVQFIRGKVADAEALRRQSERWDEEVGPGAEGWLGSTAGVTDSGDVFVAARFASADAARRNSDRPEQSAWWNETAKCFAGEPVFTETEDVESYLDGGSDDAGFVQVMIGSADREKLSDFEDRTQEQLAEVRPDLIGGLRGWIGPREFIDVAYFTSEAEARANEAKMSEQPELFGEWQSLVGDMQFLDLRDPWMHSA